MGLHLYQSERSGWPLPFPGTPRIAMSKTSVPDEVRRFILTSVPSVPYLEALLLLQNSIQNEVRPLSWMIGPQGVQKMPKLSMRDAKQAERMAATTLRTPDSV